MADSNNTAIASSQCLITATGFHPLIQEKPARAGHIAHMAQSKHTILIFMLLSLFVAGCAPFMAAKQPGKKDIDLFSIGTPRSALLGEFGSPAVSEMRDGKKFEVFKFVQGYSTGAKAGRALMHGVADVATLGLWEVVGIPGEAVFSGEEMAYEVSYDQDCRVDHVTALKK